MKLADLDRLLTRERVRAYSLMLVAANLIAAVAMLALSRGGLDPWGKPVGYDFITFYAASDLALQGKAALAYVPEAIVAAQRAAVTGSDSVFLWHYPPTFQLIVLPLALVDYGVAYAVWVIATFGLYLAMVRRLTEHPLALLVAAAFPAVFMNAFLGQNGFLSAALLGFGLMLLDRRPWLAGLLLGLLVYKPHLGVLLPFLFVAGGFWRAFAGATISASLLIGATVLAFGVEPWVAFAQNLGVASGVLERQLLPWAKMPSWFVTFAYLGVPQAMAYALHAAVALSLAGLTLLAWRRPGPFGLKVALAVIATLTVSPYAFHYDLALLAIPGALLVEHARRHPVPAGVWTAVALAFVAPVLGEAIARLHLQLMPAAVLLLYAATWRTWRLATKPVLAESEQAARGFRPHAA